MDHFFHIPTELLFGDGIVMKNADKLARLGKRALIVAGKSADANGSLSDIYAALDEKSVAHARVMGPKPNPDQPDVQRIVDAGRDFRADFIVAIGGGSPIDASKVAAALLAQGLNAASLERKPLKDAALPLAAIPTTAGTGTEANSYSIITLENPKRKKTFLTPAMAPRLGLLDPKYTYSLDADQTASTAIDAMAHLVEGYVRTGRTRIGEMLALEGLSRLADCKDALLNKTYDAQARSNLLYAAMIGGVTLAHCRTLAPHQMGYQLTNFRGMPHGQACGVLMASFLDKTRAGCEEQIGKILRALGMNDLGELKAFIAKVLPPHGDYTREELERYAEGSAGDALGKPNPVEMDREMLLNIFVESLIEN